MQTNQNFYKVTVNYLLPSTDVIGLFATDPIEAGIKAYDLIVAEEPGVENVTVMDSELILENPKTNVIHINV